MTRKNGAKKCKFIPAGVIGAIPGMVSFATWMMKKKIEKANTPDLFLLKPGAAKLQLISLVIK